MGISKDLKLQGNDFSNIATFLFVGLLCFEIPNSMFSPLCTVATYYSTPWVISPCLELNFVPFNCTLRKGHDADVADIAYFLQAVPAAKWLGLNVTLWGIATACGAAAHNYQTLLVSRIFLGIFEATIGPSLMLISSQWYTKSEQAPRFSFWYLGLGLGQILGGAISYGFQHISPAAALSGWRTMFVVLGCITVAIGLCTFFFLPDTPMQAKWLSDNEKVALLKHVSVNQTGIQSRKFRPREILDALLDPQVYLLLLSVVLVRFGYLHQSSNGLEHKILTCCFA